MCKLGDKVRDNISGFEGIATGYCQYLFGCAQFYISPEQLKDGRPLDGIWLDEQRVELVEAREIKVSPTNTSTSGGPQSNAPRISY